VRTAEPIPSQQGKLKGGHDPSIGAEYQFKPGESGNPGGRPKVTDEDRVISRIYKKILSDPNNCERIEESILKMLTGGRMVAQLTLKEMAERTEGKVTQPVEVEGNISVISEVVQKARKRAAQANDSNR
jgi:hypothetical protein